VTGYRKKIVTFLVAVALGGGALVVCSTWSTSAEPATEKSKSEIRNSKPKGSFLFATDPNFAMKSADNFGAGELRFKTMISVLLVIALGAAAIYVSRKLLPRITNLPGKEIRIIETLHIGPRKTVHLMEIGNQRLLIGSTNENITMLADVTGADKCNEGHLRSPGALTEPPSQGRAPFSGVLQNETITK